MSNYLQFTIIIPTYNREKFTLSMLVIVFAHTYPNFEIIVVDNCSTDGTIGLLKPLADAGKIILIRQEKNLERAFSRKIGMEHARSDFRRNSETSIVKALGQKAVTASEVQG